MNQILLSVIIPVYNVERTLARCVESVLAQGVEEMEVILVDDGSSDGSPALCRSLAREDSRLRVIHKPNGGLSDARNAGIDVARGRYIAFADSDDWLAPDTLAPLLALLRERPDCLMLEFSVSHVGGARPPLLLPRAEFAHPRRYWEHTGAWQHAYACNKIYQRSLLERHHLRFPRGRVFEDLFFLPLLLRHCHAGVILTTPQGFYCYTPNPHGISATQSARLGGLWQHLLALLLAAWRMRTLPLPRAGAGLYRQMLCRLADMAKVLLRRVK